PHLLATHPFPTRRSSDLHQVAIPDAEFFSEQGMNFAQGLRILVNQTADAPRLRSGQVLGHHAAVREKNRILVVHVLSGRTIIVSVESGLAVRMMKPAAFEQSRCAGMIRRGSG